MSQPAINTPPTRHVTVTTSRLATREEVAAALEAFAAEGAKGWCSFTDRVVEVTGANSLSGSKPILHAELTLEDRSLSLRHLGPGWLLADLRVSEGDSHWVVSQTFAAVAPGDDPNDEPEISGTVTYEVFWATDPFEGHDMASDFCPPVGPVASRFVNYDPEGRLPNG